MRTNRTDLVFLLSGVHFRWLWTKSLLELGYVIRTLTILASNEVLTEDSEVAVLQQTSSGSNKVFTAQGVLAHD
jgi:hypothetical protein